MHEEILRLLLPYINTSMLNYSMENMAPEVLEEIHLLSDCIRKTEAMADEVLEKNALLTRENTILHNILKKRTQ